MISKLRAGMALMRAGKVVADPKKWKSRQITSSMLVAVLWAVVQAANAFGMEVPVDEQTVDGIAIGILSVVNLVLTIATTDKIGV